MFTTEEVRRLLDIANTGLHQGEVLLARRIYDGILAGRPDHVPTLISLALLHIATGEFEAADELLTKRVLELSPEDPDALVYLGLSAKLSGRPDEARDYFARVPEDGAAGRMARALEAE